MTLEHANPEGVIGISKYLNLLVDEGLLFSICDAG